MNARALTPEADALKTSTEPIDGAGVVIPQKLNGLLDGFEVVASMRIKRSILE